MIEVDKSLKPQHKTTHRLNALSPGDVGKKGSSKKGSSSGVSGNRLFKDVDC